MSTFPLQYKPKEEFIQIVWKKDDSKTILEQWVPLDYSAPSRIRFYMESKNCHLNIKYTMDVAHKLAAARKLIREL